MIEPINSLFRAFEREDPPPKRQAAVTPEFLKATDRWCRDVGLFHSHIADLVVGAFFFAMRACEFCKTPRRGRTKLVTLDDITFRGEGRRVISLTDPMLREKARHVTVRFRDQKNGVRMDKRTQGLSGNSRLCPVMAWARACRRVLETVEGASKDTPVCQVGIPSRTGRRVLMVKASDVARTLRLVCRNEGGASRFGFGPDDLGTRSIRSGAAMALFLMHHSVERIKILGRWSSDAFLVYIRPQVLEWTSIMASDMVRANDFLDLRYDRATRGEDWREVGIKFPNLSRSHR